MKITFLVSSLGSGGAERVAATLCNAWAARGDRVTLIPTYSGGGTPFYAISESVELVYLADQVTAKRGGLFGYINRLSRLRQLLSDRRPDVIVSFLPNVNIAAILCHAFLDIPLVICERRDPASQSFSFALEAGCRLLYRYADLLVVQTESVAQKMPKIYKSPKRVRSVSNPLPEAIMAAVLPPKSGRKTLISMGRLVEEKQVDKILLAFQAISDRQLEWDLCIYGEGPLSAALELKIQELGLQGRAFLKGATSTPWDVMARADAFVMASKFEGFPNALLEAMGMGLPCVVFDCPSGPRDLTNQGEDGLLVPLGDQDGFVAAMTRIMDDEDFRLSLGKRARESMASRYGLKRVLGRWDEVFKEVGARS